MTGQDGADPGTGRARPSAPDFPKEASQSSLLGWSWGRTEHWGLSRPGAGMGVGEDQTEHRRFQVPGSLRPPPFLKDLAIAKPLPLPLLWLPPRPGCGSLLQGVRGEDKQTLSALPSKSSLSLYFLPFFLSLFGPVPSLLTWTSAVISLHASRPIRPPPKPEGAREHPSQAPCPFLWG